MKGASKIAYIVVLVFIVIGLMLAMQMGWLNVANIPGPGGGGWGTTYNCPDTGLTNVTFNVQNILDDTTADVYDETIVCTSAEGSVKTITATSDDGTNMACAEAWTCRGTSSDGVKGDHANFQSVLSGDATVSNGEVTFTTDGPSMRIDIGSTLHGIAQSRLYDNSAAAFCFGTTSGETGGAAGAWLNTTSYIDSSTNATNLAVGTAGNLDLCQDFRIYAHSDEQFMDFAYYILLDAATTVWDTPTVTVDGVTMTDMCGQMNSDEQKAYSGEEYCYKVTDPNSAITNNDYARVCVNINALSGVDPTTDINITIASVGGYTKTTAPTVVARASVKDDSSQTAVFTKQVWVWDIS